MSSVHFTLGIFIVRHITVPTHIFSLSHYYRLLAARELNITNFM